MNIYRFFVIAVFAFLFTDSAVYAASGSYNVTINNWNPNQIGAYPLYSNSSSSYTENQKPSNAKIQGNVTVCFSYSYGDLPKTSSTLYFYLNGNPYPLHDSTHNSSLDLAQCYLVTPSANTFVNNTYRLDVATCGSQCPTRAPILGPWSVMLTYAYPQNGVCGGANGQTLTTAPTTNLLCTTGNASSISGSGHPWSWTCYGTDGGSNSGCSATIQTNQLIVNKTGTGSGSVTPNIGTISWSGNTGTAAYDYGTSVTLTATPAAGKIFTGWSGACSGQGPCSVTLTAPSSVSAMFVPAITQILNLLLMD